MDISADLEELAQTPVMVVCAGAKSILDLGLTLEYLETHGVPVILLAKIKDITGGDSLAANIQLVYNNARLATATAVELSKLRKAD